MEIGLALEDLSELHGADLHQGHVIVVGALLAGVDLRSFRHGQDSNRSFNVKLRSWISLRKVR